MKRSTAYELLGTQEHARIAILIGVTKSAVDKWPDELPRATADRVLAYCTRRDWEDVRNRMTRAQRRGLNPLGVLKVTRRIVGHFD